MIVVVVNILLLQIGLQIRIDNPPPTFQNGSLGFLVNSLLLMVYGKLFDTKRIKTVHRKPNKNTLPLLYYLATTPPGSIAKNVYQTFS